MTVLKTIITFSILIFTIFHTHAQYSVKEAIEQANQQLWNKFIDKYGIVRDFVGKTPTPEDCALGRPNAIGWWSPIENGAFFTGLYLTAACERAMQSGDKADKDKARKLAEGLLKCASISDNPGFIVRGVGTDGKCHYPLGSVDQTIPWYLGLYAYAKSDLPSESERKHIIDKLKNITLTLQTSQWKLPCDGIFKGEYRGDLLEKNYLEVTCYLFVLRMMYDLTSENIWLDRYKTAIFEYPEKSELNRAEICAVGYRIDSTHVGNLDKSQLWIYVKNQATLAHLYKMETDEKIKRYYHKGLTQNTNNALDVINEYKKFDNSDIKVFGHADWQRGYPNWFPQKTQNDAERLAGMGDKNILGERKSYERHYMTNPLAAAAIIALADNNDNREIIEQVICHYDYSKLNLSEFFFAEMAYYALPNNAHASVSAAIGQVEQELWTKFIDEYGIMHDFVGDTPTPEDCSLGRPNVIGWWSPIENASFFTGLYLTAMCERALRSGEKADREKASRLASGLMKCASVSDVPGFISRGVGSDGKCHYPLGSADQTVPWYLGLYSYLKSDIPTAGEREQILKKIEEVTAALVQTDWELPCAGAFKDEFRDGLARKKYLEVTCYLFILRMMYDLTSEIIWIEKYQQALAEYPDGSDKTRAEICAAGFFNIDKEIVGEGKGQLWIYVKNQMTLAFLASMENNEAIQAYYHTGLSRNAKDVLKVIGEYKKFDNNDKKVFGHANWREGYSHWFPQKTQKDGVRLASMGNKEILGERKGYERRMMTNPLAAAAIIALAGDNSNREIIKQVICHYDYSKLNLSEFFFAAIAYYALPDSKHASAFDAVEQVEQELWTKFIDEYGIMHDFVGEIPTPEDCTLGRPNAVGWRSPIANATFFTGLYLTAMCERACRSGNKADKEKASRLANGLIRCASVSDVPGFISRGVGSDGKCHYPLGSADQTVPWYLGLYRYLKSNIPTTEEREQILKKIEEITAALVLTNWELPCDGAFRNEFRDGLTRKNYLEVTCYLFVLKMMHDLTNDHIWLDQYRKALAERPLGSDKTRAEICAAGFSSIDHDIVGDGKGQLWIYIKNQMTLAFLASMENDETIRAYYCKGIFQNAEDALKVISEYKKFDNNDKKIFGHANWREGYSRWFPQKTQADAEKLVNMGNREILGERREYERKFMSNPLAAAAIIALRGDNYNRETIERVICHYDYSKLNLSKFFFAEVAYYALPLNSRYK